MGLEVAEDLVPMDRPLVSVPPLLEEPGSMLSCLVVVELERLISKFFRGQTQAPFVKNEHSFFKQLVDLNKTGSSELSDFKTSLEPISQGVRCFTSN